MNPVRTFLKQIIKIESAEEDKIYAKMCFPVDFPAFNGHFPDYPILPGIIHIQSILMILELTFHTSFKMKHILRARYKLPVKPDELIDVLINFKKNKNMFQISARLTHEQEKKSDVKILCQSDRTHSK